MTMQDLFSLIQARMAVRGLKLSDIYRNSMQCSWFVIADELERRKICVGASGYEAVYGYCMEVRKCSHRNGASEDTSYYVAIESWDRSSGHDVKKIKLMRSQTEGTLTRKLDRLIDEYRQMITEDAISRQLDELLDQAGK